jgi:hypothetical protein
MNFFLSETSEDVLNEMDTAPYASEIIPVSSLPDNLILNFAEGKKIKMSDIPQINEPWVKSQGAYYSLYHKNFSETFLIATGRYESLSKSRVEIERKRKSMEKQEGKRKK